MDTWVVTYMLRNISYLMVFTLNTNYIFYAQHYYYLMLSYFLKKLNPLELPRRKKALFRNIQLSYYIIIMTNKRAYTMSQDSLNYVA